MTYNLHLFIQVVQRKNGRSYIFMVDLNIGNDLNKLYVYTLQVRRLSLIKQ
jgi:hypothetical protein